MDITEKYRTKHPPKEHEEAVRLLFEEITNNNNNNNTSKYKVTQISNSRGASSNSYESEGKSLNSSIHASASDLASSSASRDQIYASMPSKSTSTSDSNSSSQFEYDVMFKKPIPSRTIAVQCDLKASSFKNDNLFDGSMQASSISSTRYGFYAFSPEALENRRKSQRATSSEEIEQSCKLRKPQVETPTSMSDLSLGASLQDADARCEINISDRQAVERRLTSLRNSKLIQRSSSRLNQPARAKIDSLPRRPVTAMSYVSTSRLRDQQESPNLFREENQNQQQQLRKNISRTMSQQTLTRPRIEAPPANPSSNFNSESDSDLSQEMDSSMFKHGINRLGTTEELLLSKKYLPTPSKPPRPTLVSGVHNEHIRDYRTLDREPTQGSKLVDYRDKKETISTSNNRLPINVDRVRQLDMNSNQMPRSRGAVNQNLDNEEASKLYSLNNSYSTYGKTESATVNYSLPHQYPYDEESKRITKGLNSMSLSRKPRANQTSKTNYEQNLQSSGYCTANRRHYRSKRDANLEDSSCNDTIPTSLERESNITSPVTGRSEAARSNSVRHKKRFEESSEQDAFKVDDIDDRIENQSLIYLPQNTLTRNKFSQHIESEDEVRNDSDNSEPARTKIDKSNNARLVSRMPEVQDLVGRNSSKSYGARNISKTINDREFKNRDANQHDKYFENDPMKNDFSSHNSSSESYMLGTGKKRSPRAQALNYVSQQRLNEIGLPEVHLVDPVKREDSSASYIDMTNHKSSMLRKTSQITGRAMSQQSLTRPTMPLSSARRRRGSNSGSDVGDSSMSLMSRLRGRYENAHTRTPVVMYIPQVPASSRSNLSEESNPVKVSNLRKSIRSRQKASSQDRSRRRSLSRNGSDSESSSMLRTLMKPRTGRAQTNYSSKRMSRVNNSYDHADDYEDTDGVAQLASELDTYRFRRRYSVPKDAKINWFSKLRQRVSSGGR